MTSTASHGKNYREIYITWMCRGTPRSVRCHPIWDRCQICTTWVRLDVDSEESYDCPPCGWHTLMCHTIIWSRAQQRSLSRNQNHYKYWICLITSLQGPWIG
eukprot:PhF_6_TR25612/c0_g2_i2/m.35955